MAPSFAQTKKISYTALDKKGYVDSLLERKWGNGELHAYSGHHTLRSPAEPSQAIHRNQKARISK